MLVLDQDGHVRDRLEEESQLELRKFINNGAKMESSELTLNTASLRYRSSIATLRTEFELPRACVMKQKGTD